MKHVLYVFLVLGFSAPLTASEPVAFGPHKKSIPSKLRSKSVSCGPDGFFSEKEKQLAFEKLAETNNSLKTAFKKKNRTEEDALVKKITGLERMIDLNDFLNNEMTIEAFFIKNNLSNAGLGCYFYLVTKLGITKKSVPSMESLTKLLHTYNKKKLRSQSTPPTVLRTVAPLTKTTTNSNARKNNRVPSASFK